MKLTDEQKEQRQKLRAERAKPSNVGRLKKTLMYLDISDLTYDQWVKYRKEYLGGSDMATIFGLNPYQSKLELFHEKVGVVSKTGEETEATYAGHVLEQHIIDNYWVFHDMDNPDWDSFISHAKLGARKPLRYARKVKDKMIYDPKWPHIKINIDGFIQNTRFEKAPRGLLEIKSGLGRVWDTYEAGIPVFYIIQVQTYLLITGLKYAEIGVLLDGRKFQCFPIWANEEIQQRIIQESKEFWNTVEEGRQIWNDPTLTEGEKIGLLSEIEPEPDGSKAIDAYLKERFRSDYKAGQALLTPEIIEAAKDYLDASEVVNDRLQIKGKYGQLIKQFFLNHGVDELIDAEGKVHISNRKQANGSIVLRVNKSVHDL